MKRKTSLRIASILLFFFGFFEIIGLVMLMIPSEYFPDGMSSQSTFWGLLSGLYGIARLVAGYAILKNKKWGLILGYFLCGATLVVAPLIDPFGILDLFLASIILVCLLYANFGNGKILSED